MFLTAGTLQARCIQYIGAVSTGPLTGQIKIALCPLSIQAYLPRDPDQDEHAFYSDQDMPCGLAEFL